jgi:uncharacterized protein (TIGR00730 family)
MPLNSVAVFCGSQPGNRPAYENAARAFGERCAAEGVTIIYGGGRAGLMGHIADAALARGGQVIGVMPSALWNREIGHTGLTDMHIVETMHERKAMMTGLSDGFVALPGGLGTLEELFEVWTWAQLGIHQKPVALLNTAGFYDRLTDFLDQAVVDGFVRPDNRASLVIESEPAALLDRLRAHQPRDVQPWVEAGGK